MNFPIELLYASSHEWVRDLGGGIYEIGISDYAQKELGDLVYINLPQAGDSVKAGESFADLESVKAVSEIYSSVTGTVKEINESLISSPELINQSPYDSWLIRIEGKIEKDLLSSEDYQKQLDI